MSNDALKIGGGVCLICVILIIITSVLLVGFSFSKVEVDEYGILYNKFKVELGQEVETSGRRFTGITKTYKTFPRRYQIIEFSANSDAIGDPLPCFTNEGVGVYIELSFYIRLEKDKIRDFYLNFGDYWYANIVRKGYASIKEVCPRYGTTEYFSQREEIAEAMQDYIQENFDSVFFGAVTVESLQLRNLEYDDPLEEAITEKLIQLINKRVYEIRQEATIIEKETELIENYAENNITLIEAEKTVEAISIIQNANADAMKTILDQIATSYGKLQSTLGMNANLELLQFIFMSELYDIEKVADNKMFIGANDASVNFWLTGESN